MFYAQSTMKVRHIRAKPNVFLPEVTILIRQSYRTAVVEDLEEKKEGKMK